MISCVFAFKLRLNESRFEEEWFFLAPLGMKGLKHLCRRLLPGNIRLKPAAKRSAAQALCWFSRPAAGADAVPLCRFRLEGEPV